MLKWWIRDHEVQINVVALLLLATAALVGILWIINVDGRYEPLIVTLGGLGAVLGALPQVARILPPHGLRPLKPQDCNRESNLKTLSSDTPTRIRFTNTTSKALKVYWLDSSGNRRQMEIETSDENGNRRLEAVLRPNQQSNPISTHLTHPFVVTTLDNECLGVYLPTIEPSEAILRE